MEEYKDLVRGFLSERAYAFRIRSGLTQEVMAERMRISCRAYSDLERGNHCFSALALLTFLAMLGPEELSALVLDFRDRLDKFETGEL